MPPAILLAGAGAGNNITLHLDVDEPTSVAFGALPLSNKVRRGVVIIVAIEVRDGSIDEGSEVEELRGGLGSFKTMSHIFPLFVFGLDLKSEDFLLPVDSIKKLSQ
jgi:hypothetical protein